MKLAIIFNPFSILGFLLFSACSEDDMSAETGQEPDSVEDSSYESDFDDTETGQEVTDTDTDTVSDQQPSDEPCTHLFRNPTESTGLPSEMCKPFFNCEGVEFAPPTYTPADVEWLESRVHLNPPEEMAENPYDNPEKYPNEPDKVCGVIFEDEERETYRLETFDTLEDLEKAGAQLTHSGACGHCSSLQNLAVYIKNPELTGPVKSCGAKDIFVSEEKTINCLMKIGFDRVCAKVWYYNTRNTRSECILKCLDDFFSTKYHNKDGSLNDCIQCDEDKSGPIFKATSGRTRRNSGLPSALCRPCESVTTVIHHYR